MTISGTGSNPTKTVVFVAGSAYSGSTLLDMLLSNDPMGFSCGEIVAFVHPTLAHHQHPPCSCGDRHCQIWSEEIRTSASPHTALFSKHPNLQFMVDSSKFLPWIIEHSNRLTAAGLSARHVLIWKRPEEYFASRKKRGETLGWAKSWIEYHRDYLSTVRPDAIVAYSDLVSIPDTLRSICEKLGISYFSEKANYWEKKHHTLFGNSSAKIHLHDTKTGEYQSMANELSSIGSTTGHRQVSYQPINVGQLSDCNASEIRKMQVLVAYLTKQATAPWPITRVDHMKTRGSLVRQKMAQKVRELKLSLKF